MPVFFWNSNTQKKSTVFPCFLASNTLIDRQQLRIYRSEASPFESFFGSSVSVSIFVNLCFAVISSSRCLSFFSFGFRQRSQRKDRQNRQENPNFPGLPLSGPVTEKLAHPNRS